jgi:hypothetical protein
LRTAAEAYSSSRGVATIFVVVAAAAVTESPWLLVLGDRLEASGLLADRGWGKAAVFAPQEGDSFDLEEVEAAAEEFRDGCSARAG